MMEKAQTAIEGGNESIEASAESTRINHDGSLPEEIPKIDTTRPADPFEVPDGGTAAWLCAFGGFMISFTCYGVANTFGVFEDYYSANQLYNESLNNISWIGSLQLCLILLVGCVSGPLCDAGYFKHLIGFGGLLFFLCLMMTSISTVYYEYILSQGVGVGLAQGLLFTPGMAVLTHHFKRHRTLIFGIFAAGASIGGVILPIALQRLFKEVGFAWGVRIRKDYLAITLAMERSSSVGFPSLYAPVNFGVVYATDHQMSQQLAFYSWSEGNAKCSLAILNAGSLVGRTLPNILATIFGPLNLLIVSCTASSVLLYIWFLATGNGGMLVFEAIYGVTSGKSFPQSFGPSTLIWHVLSRSLRVLSTCCDGKFIKKSQ
ncbi:major facilitator superfamily domain-containing protein [Lentinula aff. lateritia]|uniref:Major facilitator superfamily domain-containing protein n=1 Tax=Lentinula aff. lateritia TaxID=2804960 RepID=A0ACC1U4W0_9AGAR|nr:major facilitator superfamily domain-containing protein [Lentinula aff. lateritia]